ncbi:MAG: hypothetical protein ACREO0_01025 [Pseudoxanthomonas sp.]
MATWCPDLSGDAAINLVGSAHDKFMQLGTDTYNLAIANLDGLNNITLTPANFTADFTFDDQLTPFHRPTRPTFVDADLEFRDPGLAVGAAPSFEAGIFVVAPAPEFTDLPPVLTFGGRPSTPNITLPSQPASPVPMDLPIAPDYVLPPVPTFESLNLPTMSALQIPEWDSLRPEFIEPPFNDDWNFEPQAYVQNLVEEMTETLRPMIVGSRALPQIIANLIWEQGRSRIDLETDRSIESETSQWASRGFSEPPGQLKGRVNELRQTGLNAQAENARAVAIKEFEEAAAQQRFAITQGAALEGVLIQLHVGEQGTLLQAAQFQRESAIAVLNWRKDVYNLRLQGYQTDAAVLRDRIQAELAKVEVFRAQIEGERARGEINEQRVRLYQAQLQGIQTLADFYKTQVQTVEVQANINRQDIERYKAAVEAYGERWRAHSAEWQGYIASVEGESKKVDVYRAQVDANAKRVDAWATEQNLNMDVQKLRISEHQVHTDVWRAGITRLESALGSERARLAAVGQAYDARARIYQADADVESAASAASDRSFQLGLEAARADLDAQLQRAQMQIRNAEFLIQQIVEIQRAKASIASQLAASTMSAVSYGASISSGRSKSIACSTNFSFQGETADAGI